MCQRPHEKVRIACVVLPLLGWRNAPQNAKPNMVRTSIWSLAEAAVRQVAQSTRLKKAAIEVTDEAAARIRALLEARHKVGQQLTEYVLGLSGIFGAQHALSPRVAGLPKTRRKEERMQRVKLYAELCWWVPLLGLTQSYRCQYRSRMPCAGTAVTSKAMH